MVSFAVQKHLSLIRSHLFVFIFITLGGGSKKILLLFMSEYSVYMFSAKSFIVSNHTVGSIIHFEFIFVYGVEECSNFIPLHVTVRFCQHHLLKRLSPLHCIFFLCQRLGDNRCMGLFWGFLTCSIHLCFCFCAHSILFYSFVV